VLVIIDVYPPPLSTQAAHYDILLPQLEPRYWQLAIRPMVLSPGPIPDASTLGPGMSDGCFRADVQIPAGGSRPGRVSERRGGEKNISLLTLA
jgi:hypothetical protein